MRVTGRAVLLAALVLGADRSSGAQDSSGVAERTAAATPLATLAARPPIAPGARVRVGVMWLLSDGRIREIRGDTLIIGQRFGRGPRALALDGTQRVWVWEGKQSRVRGALIGAGGGALAALLVSSEVVLGLGGSVRHDSRVIGELTGRLLPAAITVGAIAGAALPGDRWRRVTFSPLRTR